MSLDLFAQGVLIGRLIRSCPGTVFAWDAAGQVVGTFADIDAAADTLIRRAAA